MPELPVYPNAAKTKILPRTRPSSTPMVWQPSRPVTVLFMRNAVTCPVFHLIQHYSATKPAKRLHVVVNDQELIVTTADDLHRPGLSLCGRQVMDRPGVKMFRLLDEALPGVDPRHHVSAAGIAVLSWSKGVHRLKVTGLAMGLTCKHDRIFDAVDDTDPMQCVG